MKTYAQLPFHVSPEFKIEYMKEAERLGTTQIGLFYRMWKTHQTVTAEEEKRKERKEETK